MMGCSDTIMTDVDSASYANWLVFEGVIEDRDNCSPEYLFTNLIAFAANSAQENNQNVFDEFIVKEKINSFANKFGDIDALNMHKFVTSSDGLGLVYDQENCVEFLMCYVGLAHLFGITLFVYDQYRMNDELIDHVVGQVVVGSEMLFIDPKDGLISNDGENDSIKNDSQLIDEETLIAYWYRNNAYDICSKDRSESAMECRVDYFYAAYDYAPENFRTNYDLFAYYNQKRLNTNNTEYKNLRDEHYLTALSGNKWVIQSLLKNLK